MFENEEDAQRAIEGLNRNGLQASFARVGQVDDTMTSIYIVLMFVSNALASSKESFSARLRSLQDETSANIYVSNLPPAMNEPVSLYNLCKITFNIFSPIIFLLKNFPSVCELAIRRNV